MNTTRNTTYVDEKKLKFIINQVFKITGVTLEKLLSKSRKGYITDVRLVVMALARKHTKYSDQYIADYFRRISHASTIHATKRVTERVNEDWYLFRSDIRYRLVINTVNYRMLGRAWNVRKIHKPLQKEEYLENVNYFAS